MSVTELQKRVIQNISSVEDLEILEKINQLIDATSKAYILSNHQTKLVEEAREDYKNGNFITQQEIKNKVEEWKKRK